MPTTPTSRTLLPTTAEAPSARDPSVPAITATCHALWLWVLLALFCFRVAAQLIQTQWPVRWLPDFESWHSAVLFYPLLFAAQLLIVAFYGWMAWRVTTGRLVPSRRAGRIWTTLAIVYVAVMFARLVIGASELSAARWFHSYISIAFHFVLAGFLYVVGLYHRRGAARD